ncbi:hypothetical protein HY642_00120, partial [Candidatus Woesearchaeota archaeon]|nr:hypothetical protein [Candidatus Woesearchaeota archaeon]
MPKGISPLLAGVVLVGMTVAIAVLVSGWLSTTITTSQRTVANRTVFATDCTTAEIVIDNVYSEAGHNRTARAVVRNAGQTDGLQISAAQLYDRLGSNFTTTASLPITLNKGQIAIVNFTFPNYVTTTADSSRLGNNGTLTNSPSWTLGGRYGSA